MTFDEVQESPPFSSSPSQRICPACERDTSARPLGSTGTYVWHSCRECGTHFVHRLPTPQELSDLYAGYYHQENMSPPEFVWNRLHEVLSSFRRYRETGKLLDVGYGAGTVLKVAHQQGWECWGQEVSPEPLRMGRERGWHVLEGDLCAIEVPRAEFDVVSITEVLEHLEHPVPYLRRAFEALRPGGLLYMTTPNGLSMTSRILGVRWSNYAPPEHLQLFTNRSLPELCRRVGFVHGRVRAEGLNPYEIWRRWRRSEAPSNRVQTAYALNERLSSGVLPRLVKGTANHVLSLTGLGDTLKYEGEKPIAPA
jgi:SAM-dependent methyltransferase